MTEKKVKDSRKPKAGSKAKQSARILNLEDEVEAIREDIADLKQRLRKKEQRLRRKKKELKSEQINSIVPEERDRNRKILGMYRRSPGHGASPYQYRTAPSMDYMSDFYCHMFPRL